MNEIIGVVAGNDDGSTCVGCLPETVSACGFVYYLSGEGEYAVHSEGACLPCMAEAALTWAFQLNRHAAEDWLFEGGWEYPLQGDKDE